mgnify:CR=1 FL=1
MPQILFSAMRELCPECDFGVHDGVLVFRSAPELKPSDEEIQNKIDEIEKKLPMTELRFRRDMLLKECDYKMVSDYKHKNKQAWIDYRQSLRDLPKTITDIKGNELDYPAMPID